MRKGIKPRIRNRLNQVIKTLRYLQFRRQERKEIRMRDIRKVLGKEIDYFKKEGDVWQLQTINGTEFKAKIKTDVLKSFATFYGYNVI